MNEENKYKYRKAYKIAVIALIFAVLAFTVWVSTEPITYTNSTYYNNTTGGGGVSFNGSAVDLNGSYLYNGTLKNTSTLIFSYDNIGSQEWVNISGLSINNDSYYDIYSVFNVTGSASSLKIFFNGDFNENNYTRQYVYASGATLISALDFSTDISAASDGMSSSSKIHIEKSHNGKVRLIIEGGLDEGVSFFNMQMYYSNVFGNTTNDINSISFRLAPKPTESGVKIHVFALR